MSDVGERRRVLIVEDEPAIRNVLFALLAGLNCDGDIAVSGKQALAMVGREQFDAVLLDLRCSNLAAEQVVSEIKEVQPSLVGRVLVITGEVADPETLDLIERHCLLHLPRNRLLQDLWLRLRTLFGASPSHNTVH